MNYKMLVLCVLSTVSVISLNATTQGFAPYDKERGFGFDAHGGGGPVFGDDSYGAKIFALDVNGYYKVRSGQFFKLGISTYFLPVWFLPVLPLPNAQIGKYYKGTGALRLGLFHGFPGIGADAWMMYDRFKWLMTLETFGLVSRGDVTIGCSWLNRLFFTDALYATGVINYLGGGGKRGIAYGFIGLGAAF